MTRVLHIGLPPSRPAEIMGGIRARFAMVLALGLWGGLALGQENAPAERDDLDVTMQILVDPDAKLPDEVVRRIELPARKADPPAQRDPDKGDPNNRDPDKGDGEKSQENRAQQNQAYDNPGKERAAEARQLGREMGDRAKEQAQEAAERREEARRSMAEDRRRDDRGPPADPPGRPPRPPRP